MEKSDLQKAVELMEANGFHISRAYEENNRDVGNVTESSSYAGQESLTGALILRITPKSS